MNGSGARRAVGAASGLDDASDPPDDASSPSNLRGAGQPPLSSVRRVAAATALRGVRALHLRSSCVRCALSSSSFVCSLRSRSAAAASSARCF